MPSLCPSPQTTAYSGNLTGLGSLTKAGSGTLTLSGANAYGGTTTINGGVVSVSTDGNLGTPPVAALPGSLTINAGTLQATTGFTLDSRRGIALGPATGSGTGTIDVAGGQTLIYDGIPGQQRDRDGSLAKSGAGPSTLSAVQTYGGATTISGGTLELSGGDHRLPTATAVTLGGTGTLNVGVNSQTIASLGVTDGATATVTGAGSLTVNGASDFKIGPPTPPRRRP